MVAAIGCLPEYHELMKFPVVKMSLERNIKLFIELIVYWSP